MRARPRLSIALGFTLRSKMSSAWAMAPAYPASAYTVLTVFASAWRVASHERTVCGVARPKLCAACRQQILKASGRRGHPVRFCGDACRAAAYRRRKQDERESLPRWPHARGTLRLSDAAEWDLAQRKAERIRGEAAEDRARQAAWNRASKQWRHARAVAGHLRVLYGSPAASVEAQVAWRDIVNAASACARLGVPGVDWEQELARAERRAAELEPRHLIRAEHRRRQREERKAEPKPQRPGVVRQLQRSPN